MKDTSVEYAVKIMEKRFIRKEKKVKFVMMERKVFSKISHDRVVKLFFTFQVRRQLRCGDPNGRLCCNASPLHYDFYFDTSASFY